MTHDPLLRQMTERSPKFARRLILAGYRGSQAHGTYLPPTEPKSTDDVDVFGVFVRDPTYYFGVSGYLRTDDTFTCAGEPLDIESHELRKFVALLCKGNPNVHQHLWLEPEDYFVIERPARILLARRERFLSQQVLNSLMGYAYGQFARMEKFEKHGYMGQKREQIVREHGYDIKNAAHCIRLLYIGLHLIRTGAFMTRLLDEIKVKVMDVKRGARTLEQVQTDAKALFEAFRAERPKLELPDTVERAFADETARLVIEAHQQELEGA